MGKASFAKTDARYWQDVIFRPAYRAADASQREVKQYHVKIQHQGRRGSFQLHTNNKAAAADRAKAIYLKLVSQGWESVLKEFKPMSQ